MHQRRYFRRGPACPWTYRAGRPAGGWAASVWRGLTSGERGRGARARGTRSGGRGRRPAPGRTAARGARAVGGLRPGPPGGARAGRPAPSEDPVGFGRGWGRGNPVRAWLRPPAAAWGAESPGEAALPPAGRRGCGDRKASRVGRGQREEARCAPRSSSEGVGAAAARRTGPFPLIPAGLLTPKPAGRGGIAGSRRHRLLEAGPARKGDLVAPREPGAAGRGLLGAAARADLSPTAGQFGVTLRAGPATSPLRGLVPSSARGGFKSSSQYRGVFSWDFCAFWLTILTFKLHL